MNLNKVACSCAGVTYGDIIKAVENGANSYEDVQRITGCGKSCINCKEFIEYFANSLIEEREDNNKDNNK